MDAAEATRKQALQTKLDECLAGLELAKSKQYITPKERSKELDRIGRKIRHCREAIDDINRVREGTRQRMQRHRENQRMQRHRENQRTSITPMINPNDNNGPRDLAIRRNGDGNPVRVGLPSIPPQVLGSTSSAPTASALTLAATNGGAIVDLTNPNEFLQHLLRSSPHVTVNCNMPGSNVTTYAGSHTVNNMMEGHQDLKDFFENTINRLVHQGIQVTGPNSNDTDRDTISRRLLDVLERQTGPIGDASTGLNGDDSTGNTKEDASLQRHKELLTRLNDVLAAMESQAQPNGPFMECIRTAVKSQTSMRRNHDDEGDNLANRFEDATSPAREDVGKEPSGSEIALSPSQDEKNRLVRETLLGGKKVQEIIQSLNLNIGNPLSAGVIDHFENILLLIRDLEAGTIKCPQVDTQGLQTLVRQHPNEKLVDIMGPTMYMFEECFVSVAYNDTGLFSEDGDEVRAQVLGEQRFPFTVQTELQLVYNDEDESEAIIAVQSMTSPQATKALAFLVETISTERNLKKLIVNGTESKLCIPPNVLRICSSSSFILHLHDCNPTHHQLQALSNSTCPLIFDKCLIDDIEDRLFSGQHLKVAFTQCCPKFPVLANFIAAGKLTCLIFHKIDVLHMYKGSDIRAAANLAVKDLNALVNVASIATDGLKACDVCCSELYAGKESLKEYLDSPRAWVPDISLDTITELGSLERLSVPTATLLFQDAKGRTICLEPCGTQIRFTNYGGKNAIFTLPVGTVQESSGGTTAKLLPDGNIEYSFGVTALVPVSATERKIWCKKCAKGTACDHHQIP